ncbi:MAG: exosortase/archaeosortase family protein [Acidobacteriales bacterium]|nr:exosortase/archaeosortase family protein [Terriglobales bacterium]
MATAEVLRTPVPRRTASYVPPFVATSLVLAAEWLVFHERLRALTLNRESVQTYVLIVSAALLLLASRRLKLSHAIDAGGIALVTTSLTALIALDAAHRPYAPTTPLLMAVCTYGLARTLFGAAQRKPFAFPSAYLLLMTPIPTPVVVLIDMPLQNLSAALAAHATALFGVPVQRTGTIIGLAHSEISLRIIGDCNGLHSAIAIFAVATLLGWLLQARPLQWLTLIASGILLSYAANIVRLTTVLLLLNHYGEHFAQHLSTFEALYGALLFALCVFALLKIARWIGCKQFREL